MLAVTLVASLLLDVTLASQCGICPASNIWEMKEDGCYDCGAGGCFSCGCCCCGCGATLNVNKTLPEPVMASEETTMVSEQLVATGAQKNNNAQKSPMYNQNSTNIDTDVSAQVPECMYTSWGCTSDCCFDCSSYPGYYSCGCNKCCKNSETTTTTTSPTPINPSQCSASESKMWGVKDDGCLDCGAGGCFSCGCCCCGCGATLGANTTLNKQAIVV